MFEQISVVCPSFFSKSTSSRARNRRRISFKSIYPRHVIDFQGAGDTFQRCSQSFSKPITNQLRINFKSACVNTTNQHTHLYYSSVLFVCLSIAVAVWPEHGPSHSRHYYLVVGVSRRSGGLSPPSAMQRPAMQRGWSQERRKRQRRHERAGNGWRSQWDCPQCGKQNYLDKSRCRNCDWYATGEETVRLGTDSRSPFLQQLFLRQREGASSSQHMAGGLPPPHMAGGLPPPPMAGGTIEALVKKKHKAARNNNKTMIASLDPKQ